MEVSYKQDVAHSYLMIKPEGEVDTKAYPLRMVLGNEIPGLLPCRLQKADGEILFYYEITALQKVTDAYQKLGYQELKKLCQGFLKIFEQMDMYLLDADQLILDLEYIYLDKGEGEMYLCYLPGYEKPIQEQLRCLTENILPRMDHADSRCVVLGYGLYRMLTEEGFQMDAVGELIQKSERESETLRSSADVQEEDRAFKGVDSHEKEEEKESGRIGIKSWVKEVAFLLAGLMLAGAWMIFRRMGYLSGITLPMMLGFVFGAILAASLALWGDNRREHKKRLKEEENQAQRKTKEEAEEAQLTSEKYDCPVLICEEVGQAPPIILNRDMAVVGKVDGVSDAFLDRSSISRMHARIQRKGQEYWIADLHSENGTFVNGKKLEMEEERLLQPEDQVTFADIDYKFIGTERE